MKFTMKQATLARGLTREEVSKAMGVSKATVSKYFNMDAIPRADKAIKFCKLVDIPFSDIIFFNDNVDAEETTH